MLFLRVIAWCGDEKFSLKKSCFYLYIRRDTFGLWSASTTGQRSYVYDKGTTYASHCKTRVRSIKPVMASLSEKERKCIYAMHKYELGYVCLKNGEKRQGLGYCKAVLSSPKACRLALQKTIVKIIQICKR